MKAENGPSQRQLRAGELIRHALGEIFMRGEIGDPDLDRLAPSVTEVQLSPDLRIATAFVRTLLPENNKALLDVLARNKRYLRGLVATRIAMKFTPDIRYKIDSALDYASKIDEILHRPEVARDLKPHEE
jgi:ribosome-binding factor A